MGRNWQWSFAQGRAKRMELERQAAVQGIAESDVDRTVPFHSHDGTMQSQFTKGWHSLDAVELYQLRNIYRFQILNTCNGKAAEHCANLRALFNKESS